MKFSISLVLGTVGRTEEIDRLIRSIAVQSVQPKELLVLDQNLDARLKPYVELAGSLGLAVRHERLHPPSLARARNKGIHLASGDVIGFPDDDCWYEPDALAAVVEAFQAEPELDGVLIRWVEQCAAHDTRWDDGKLSLEEWQRFRGGDASSISLFLRRELLNQLGGFDTRFGVGQWFGSGEETDLVLRALAQGANLRRCSAGSVHHHHPAKSQRPKLANASAVMRRARGTGALYSKHKLPMLVIFRGLLAPPVMALLHGQGTSGLVHGLAKAYGRLVGAVSWRFRSRSDHAH